MGKLVSFNRDIGEYIPLLKDKLPGWEIVWGDSATIDALPGAEIVYGWNGGIPQALAPSLKWIQVTSAGVDSIPLDNLREAGIWLTTASGVHANSISESILAMMLAFSRQIFTLHKLQLRREWQHFIGGLTEIHGKTIGIVGAGAIGQELARLCKAFDMRVLGLRRSGSDSPFFDRMYQPGGLHELLAESDYIANILPLTPETENLIGEAEFAVMKPSAIYLTAGRGKTTNTAALLNALENHKIAGAGLDVTDPEPLPPESPLWDMDSVFIGGHNSGGTDLYTKRAMEIFLSNLDDYLAGQAPGRNLVDYILGY